MSGSNSGVGILPAIDSTLENRKLEAYATLTENRKLEAYATLTTKNLIWKVFSMRKEFASIYQTGKSAIASQGKLHKSDTTRSTNGI